jgi:hypothetical protein
MNWYEAAGEYYLSIPDDEDLSWLPAEWQRELVALGLLSRDVYNGGYLQFFAHQGRETYVLASRALRAIGARRSAEIVDACQALIDEHFPDEGRSPDDRRQVLPNCIIGLDGTTVKEAGSVLPESVLGRVRELSYEFMDCPDDLGDLAQSHYGPLIEGDNPA